MVWEGLHPRFDGRLFGVEFDASEKVHLARETHDLETIQHVLSAVGSSRRQSMMRSIISCGGEDDIAVSGTADVSCRSPSGKLAYAQMMALRDHSPEGSVNSQEPLSYVCN